MNIKGRGHSLILVQMNSVQHSTLFLWNRWAAMRIYGKNLNKYPCLEQKRPITLKLDIQYRLTDSSQIYLNDETGMTLTYFTAKSYLFPYAFVWEKNKNDNFVYDIKVGRCSQSNEYMKYYEYQRSRAFIDLHPSSLRFNIFKLLFLRNP